MQNVIPKKTIIDDTVTNIFFFKYLASENMNISASSAPATPSVALDPVRKTLTMIPIKRSGLLYILNVLFSMSYPENGSTVISISPYPSE